VKFLLNSIISFVKVRFWCDGALFKCRTRNVYPFLCADNKTSCGPHKSPAPSPSAKQKQRTAAACGHQMLRTKATMLHRFPLWSLQCFFFCFCYKEFGLMTQRKTAKNICVWCQLNGRTLRRAGMRMGAGLQTPSPPNRIGNICDSFRQNASGVGKLWVDALPPHWIRIQP